jgi:hypothetical protein
VLPAQIEHFPYPEVQRVSRRSKPCSIAHFL